MKTKEYYAVQTEYGVKGINSIYAYGNSTPEWWTFVTLDEALSFFSDINLEHEFKRLTNKKNRALNKSLDKVVSIVDDEDSDKSLDYIYREYGFNATNWRPDSFEYEEYAYEDYLASLVEKDYETSQEKSFKDTPPEDISR